MDDLHHPRRFPGNAAGAFYTTGYPAPDPASPDAEPRWCGDCMFCGNPELEAPELLAPLTDGNLETYFVRQPSTRREVADACNALNSCCVQALRYGGRDRSVIERLGNDPGHCDHFIDDTGQLVATVDANGDLLPFAEAIAKSRHAELQAECQRRAKKWWQFWR